MIPTIANVGLTEIYTSPNPQVDIVLVHGLNGSPEKTWTADNGIFWPRDLLPTHLSNTSCRILTYGYDAKVSAFTDGVGKDHIHHHSENLAARLYSNRSVSRMVVPHEERLTQAQLNGTLERPIIFIVHSLGGLVVKQCLIYSRSIEHQNSAHLRSIYLSTYGILFMGTPHNGSDLAKWGTMLQSIASATLPKKFFTSSPHLVEALKTNNETLQNINRQFNEILPRLRIFYFYEAKPMDMGATRQFVVDEDSAAPNFPGVERMGIERDHSTMCKFKDAKDTGFAEVVEALGRYSADAPRTTAVRWLEEKHHRYIRQELGAPELVNDQRNSGASSPNSRLTGNTRTPLLNSNPNTPLLLEPGNSSVHTPYEIEEHEDPSKSTKLPHRQLADTNVPSAHNSTAHSTGSLPKLLRPRLVAPLGFRPNTHFVGFDIEMARLVRKLADEKRGRLGTRAVLLYGLTGSGKSHLARQYVWNNVSKYPSGVFWIDCKTPESLNKGFWNVCQTLGCFDELPSNRPDAFIDAVRTHLSNHDRWLLVFDGISFRNEEQLEAFKRYIPDHRIDDENASAGGSNIIYTTVDKTLANRQRLLDPPGIKVWPLTTEQGCELLYKSLQYRDGVPPSRRQKEKAEKLVAHYDCLPLGIHAAAHMLIARGRALEKYTPGPSDNRLAAPFLSILDALQRSERREAVNLLMIMCFLNHEIPVAMLHFGNNVLSDMGIDIRAMDLQGGSARRELDNSISVLIKNGLLERRLQSHSSTASPGRTSPEARRPSNRQMSEPAADSNEEGDSQKSSTTFVGIDVVRVHTVVQQVYLDQLRAFFPQEFLRWLIVATRFLISSWNYAYDRIKSNTGRGSGSDCREFENHAEKLWSHYPTRSEGVSHAVRQGHHDLHNVRKIIKREIDNQSPSQSSQMSGRPIFASVFEKSGSSSDEGPATPTSGLTRISTWSIEHADSTESPLEYHAPVFSNLPVSLNSSWHEDDGYLSDNEQRPTKERTLSNSTAREHNQGQLASIFSGKNSNIPFRPAPLVGSLSSAEIEPYQSRTNSLTSQPTRPGSAASLEAALAGTHKSTQSLQSVPNAARRPLSELSANQPSQNFLSRTISISPRLRHALLANTLRTELPIENASVTKRSQPMVISGRSWKPSLPSLESHSLPAEYRPIPMSRDLNLSHESTTSVQTEPVEHVNTSDEYLTPIMSPVEPPPLSPSRLNRPPLLDMVDDNFPPYPEGSSLNTVQMPGLVKPEGLGISAGNLD